MAEHVDIVDGERHEPKGAGTAGLNTVLKSNGNGSTSFAQVSYSEVIGTPLGGPVADAAVDADLPTSVAKINELLGVLRAAGLIGS